MKVAARNIKIDTDSGPDKVYMRLIKQPGLYYILAKIATIFSSDYTNVSAQNELYSLLITTIFAPNLRENILMKKCLNTHMGARVLEAWTHGLGAEKEMLDVWTDRLTKLVDLMET